MSTAQTAARYWVLPVAVDTRMTANDRLHWRRRAELTARWRRCGWVYAKQARIPALTRAHILIEWLPPDRRRRDPANAAPMGKALVDGIVDAGVLPDDSAQFLDGPDYRLGPPADQVWRVPGRAALRVTITELAEVSR